MRLLAPLFQQRQLEAKMKYAKEIGVTLEELHKLEGGQMEFQPTPLAYKYEKQKGSDGH